MPAPPHQRPLARHLVWVGGSLWGVVITLQTANGGGPPTHPAPETGHKPAPGPFTLDVEASTGWDSNPGRVEPTSGEARTPSGFAALGATVRGAWAVGHGGILTLGGQGGAKVHFDPEAAPWNLLMGRLSTALLVSSGPWQWKVDAFYLESREAGSAGPANGQILLPRLMDFRLARVEVGVRRRARKRLETEVRFWGSYFDYLPTEALSYWDLGTSIQASAWWHLGSPSHKLRLEALFDWAYHGHAAPDQATGRQRRDVLVDAGATAEYEGPLLVRLGYLLTANVSNLEAWTMLRHRVSLNLAAALPWKLYAVTSLVYQYLDYPSSLLISAPTLPGGYMRLDQEGRSNLLVALQRHVYGPYTLQIRYRLFFDAPPRSWGEQAYFRHLVCVDVLVGLPREEVR